MAQDPPVHVLVVEHDPVLSRELRAFLADCGYETAWADTGEKAFNQLDRRSFDAMVAELGVPHGSGMRLMTVARERNPEICVVFIVDPAEVERGTEAMRQGAYDFQAKPVNLGKLDAVLRRGVEHQRLVLVQHGLRRRLDERYGLGNLVGQSRQMIQVYNAVRQVIPTDTSVLIQGEPGTGKELIAQAIHNNSSRRDEPFVTFDCTSMPAKLQELRLLGQAADPARERPAWQGCLDLADRGTLFLDEAWALSSPLQEQLLHTIEEGYYERPGAAQRIAVDVRVVTATTHPLDERVRAGLFNERLWHALTKVVIPVPALRDRPEDIPLLVEHLGRSSSRREDAFPGMTGNAIDLLERYAWPGNVRELRNVVEGMTAAARGERMLDVGDVPSHIRRETASGANEIRIPVGAPMSEVERLVIEQTMKACEYKKEACAKTLGIGLRTLYRKLKEYDIR
jgi:DNA-binding NtrC family response regulator